MQIAAAGSSALKILRVYGMRQATTLISLAKFGIQLQNLLDRCIFVEMDTIGAAASVIRLSALPAGKRAVIRAHDDNPLMLTLMEMGCIPGEPVWIEMIAPLGDPLAIHIAGYYLSIRKQDARNIWVEIQ
jgi:ferrous iron transport protein A